MDCLQCNSNLIIGNHFFSLFKRVVFFLTSIGWSSLLLSAQYIDFSNGQSTQTNLTEWDLVDVTFGGGPYVAWSAISDPDNIGGFVYQIDAIQNPPGGNPAYGGAWLSESDFTTGLACNDLVDRGAGIDFLISLSNSVPQLVGYSLRYLDSDQALIVYNSTGTVLYTNPLTLNSGERYRFCLFWDAPNPDSLQFWVWHLPSTGGATLEKSATVNVSAVNSIGGPFHAMFAMLKLPPVAAPFTFGLIDNLFVSDGALTTDTDADGVPDIDEAAIGTNLGDPDSDGDGFDDGTEVDLGSDPLNALNTPFMQKIRADNGMPFNAFGTSVDIDGDTAIVGSVTDCAAGSACGSAYIFARANGQWTQQAQLVPADIDSVDLAGRAVSLSGDTAIIGATQDQCTQGPGCGAAYVFTRSGSVWTEQQKLTAGDGSDRDLGDAFGWAVSIEGDTAIVSSNGEDCVGANDCGAVYAFTRSGSVWSQQQKFNANDPGSGHRFGSALSLDGDTLAVSADSAACSAGSNCGAVYVLTRTGGVWSQSQKLVASDLDTGDKFGYSVAVSDNKLIAGSRFAQCPTSNASCGAAYVFARSNTTWAEQKKLAASDITSSDNFGASVALSGSTAVIGAPYADCSAGINCGAGYVFARPLYSEWSEQQKLVASPLAASDLYAFRSALSGDTIIVGAYQDNCPDGANDCGAAYLVDLDMDDDGMFNTFEENNGFDPLIADEDNNGVVDGMDDADGDGLDNQSEESTGTNPNLADSDGDGFSDGDELSVGTDPNDNTSYPYTVPFNGVPLILLGLVLGLAGCRRIRLQRNNFSLSG